MPFVMKASRISDTIREIPASESMTESRTSSPQLLAKHTMVDHITEIQAYEAPISVQFIPHSVSALLVASLLLLHGVHTGQAVQYLDRFTLCELSSSVYSHA